jgi:tetratricopeptide (TPR) repeat protein
MRRQKQSIVAAAVLTVLACMAGQAGASGCRHDVGSKDDLDRSLPLVRKAEACRAAGEIDNAIRFYNEALVADPGAARAHLDLALLLHDQRKDPVLAVYHYRQYLVLRPNTEKRLMIESRIRLATQLLSAHNAEAGQLAMKKVELMEQENAALRVNLERLQHEVSTLRAALERTAPAIKAPPAGTAGGRTGGTPGINRTYRVRRGDSFASIATQVYGDANEWRRIYEANKDVVPNKDTVPVGAVLAIP